MTDKLVDGSEEAARELLQNLSNQINDLNADLTYTMDRENQRHKERMEDIYDRFRASIAPLQAHRDAIIKSLASVEALKPPPPIFIEKAPDHR